MIWLLTRLIVWPVKAVIGTAAFGAKTSARTAAGSAKLGYRTGKLFGYRNLVTLGLGVAAGLALAPRTGRETRELVRQRLVDLGLVGGGGWSAEGPTVYAPVETPSAEPDVTAADNGHGANSADEHGANRADEHGANRADEYGLGEGGIADAGVDGPGPVAASEPGLPEDRGTND